MIRPYIIKTYFSRSINLRIFVKNNLGFSTKIVGIFINSIKVYMRDRGERALKIFQKNKILKKNFMDRQPGGCIKIIDCFAN